MGEETADKVERAFPSESGSVVGYDVEARVIEERAENPVTIGGMTVTKHWKRVPRVRGVFGVPDREIHVEMRSVVGLMTKPQAMAIAWWARAMAPYSTMLQIRIVPSRIEYSWGRYAQEPELLPVNIDDASVEDREATEALHRLARVVRT